ncbi:MAG: hypothetical protein LBP59_12025 [Planctomycetaceae bacterium]|nr:hypothetical protein [Planctomycetaceae bacterium]
MRRNAVEMVAILLNKSMNFKYDQYMKLKLNQSGQVLSGVYPVALLFLQMVE